MCGALGQVQYFANMTTTPASSNHEIINPANIIHPRFAETVAGLLTVASGCTPSFPVRVAVPSCPAAGSTTAFDGWGDATGPVPMVEDKSWTLPLASTPIGAGRAFRFRGRGGRLFFMAYVPYRRHPRSRSQSHSAGTADHFMRLLSSHRCKVQNMDREHVKGAADKVKGAIKDTAGKVTGDKKLQSEGKFDKAKGSAHNLAGDVKDAARDASKTADD
jgi:uncharacterized protein YjbJ (UPF0337 family)